MNYTDDDIEAIVDTQIELKTRKLQQENEELKKQLEIKNDGFMASINETCEYAIILEEYEKWLETILENEKFCYLSPHGKDRYQYDIFKECLDKLQELKEGKK